MPTHREIQDFATQLAEEMGYNIFDEAQESQVLLLSRLEKPFKLA
jgi:wyosine [tRNA(Phe)-imidazoG37] synthetase (radical SAM superfamily)